MNKHIARAVLSGDEAVTLLIIEPLNFSSQG